MSPANLIPLTRDEAREWLVVALDQLNGRHDVHCRRRVLRAIDVLREDTSPGNLALLVFEFEQRIREYRVLCFVLSVLLATWVRRAKP